MRKVHNINEIHCCMLQFFLMKNAKKWFVIAKN